MPDQSDDKKNNISAAKASANEERIRKWRERQAKAGGMQSDDGPVAADKAGGKAAVQSAAQAGVEETVNKSGSAPLPDPMLAQPSQAPAASSASPALGRGGPIPTRREEELAAEKALRAEMADSRLPSEDEVQDIITNNRRRLWLQKLKIRRKAGILIGIPLLAALVYGTIITPSSKAVSSSFVIMKAGESRNGGQLAGIMGLGGGEGLGDAYRIREYLKSREAMQIMEAKYGFLSHFSNGTFDPFSRPLTMPIFGQDAHDFYQRKINIGIDVREGIVRLEVEALNDEDAARFANGLLELARLRTKEISDMLNRDQTASLQDDVQRAEAQMREASNELARAQRQNREVDPQLAATSAYQMISTLQTNLLARQAQRDALLSNNLTESPLLSRLNSEISSLNKQIQQQQEKLAGGGDRTVISAASDLGNATTKLRLSQIGLEASLRTLEQANLNNIGQRRYLVVLSKPVLAYDIWPRKLMEILGFGLIISFLIWGLSRIAKATLMSGKS